jgi:hypothetical protein
MPRFTYIAIFCFVYIALHALFGSMLTSHIILVMQRDKRGRFVSAKVCKKYYKVKLKRFGVDSTVDNVLADEKLQTLDEVGVADWCLDKPFWPPFSCMLDDSI